jgi:hypothetical protein
MSLKNLEFLGQLDAVETLDVVGGLRIGEIERAAAEEIGSQRNPGLQVRAGLNDHVGAGRAGHVETKHAVGEAKGRVVDDGKRCGNCDNNNLAIGRVVRAGDAGNLGGNRYCR